MADMVEVVRCKDCKFSHLFRDEQQENRIYRHCIVTNAFVNNNDFCSKGKKWDNIKSTPQKEEQNGRTK